MKINMKNCSVIVELERKESALEFEGGDVMHGSNQTV